ncbi:MAG TPA: Hsp20/alpha crystallin family protein [Anaerolineae bacterium]|jgi:HSP20 family protein|nr:Hsp20/alpha crystallin family protein [Anaerolineae bacterium]
MALRRWDPWRELMRMQEELGKTFERVFGPERMPEAFWTPDVDIYEKENNIIVRMDLPEVKPEDVDISIVDNTLRIKGERKHIEEVKEENYYRTERRFGSFERTIELPVAVKTEEIKATYKEGVLQITLPKAEEKKAKEIRITAA